MIDQSLLIDEFEETVRRLARKGVEESEVAHARELQLARQSQIAEVEQLRADRNRLSREIGDMMARGDRDEAERVKEKVQAIKARLDELEPELRETEAKAADALMRLPNFPADDAPDGSDDADNVVLETVGYDPADYEGKSFEHHADLAERLGILDKERGAKITGSMFAVLRGDGAGLLRALVNLALELNRPTYTEFVVPTLVNTETFTATGHLPKFEEDAYTIEKDGFWAIPTGEVPLTAMHRDEILDLADLPKRYMAYTSCFRREAGSAGKDTRGMRRLHEFHKVELVRLCAPETVQAEFDAMLKDALRPIEMLGLPYRVLDLCAGDLTFSSQRIYDIEVYSPGVDAWLEVSSVGIFSDFQMRRGNIRFRREQGAKPEYPFALNGSAIAVPRVWAAVIEHNQQPDGSILIPEPLRRFMGKDVISSED